nr:6156_t:CDS:2 [Entrophospora candida]
MLDQRDLNYDEKNNQSDLVVLLRANIGFETDNKIEEAKKRMDLDEIMDDKDDIDNLQSRKKKKDLSIIEEQFDNAEKHIITRYLGKFLC